MGGWAARKDRHVLHHANADLKSSGIASAIKVTTSFGNSSQFGLAGAPATFALAAAAREAAAAATAGEGAAGDCAAGCWSISLLDLVDQVPLTPTEC